MAAAVRAAKQSCVLLGEGMMEGDVLGRQGIWNVSEQVEEKLVV